MNASPFNRRERPSTIAACLGIVARLAAIATLAGATVCAAAVTDDTGHRVDAPPPPLRIAGLAPNVTAMLFAAGAGAEVVATTDYSVEPPAAQRVPRIGDANAVDLERLLALRPSVIVSWPDGENAAEIDRIGRLGLPVYRVRVTRLADFAGSIRRLGALAGTRAAADRQAEAIDATLAALARRYAGERPVTVLLQEWSRPVYTIGGTHLLTDALRVCGARNVFGDLRDPGPSVSTEAVVARNPDIIVAVAPQPDSDRWLAEWKRFPRMRAVASGTLIAFPDQRLTRLGPGMLEATQALCADIDGARRKLK